MVSEESGLTYSGMLGSILDPAWVGGGGARILF